MIYFIRKYLKYILAFFCVTLIFIGTYFYYDKKSNISTSSVKKLTVTKKDEITKEASKTVFIDIKGAVNAPGVYELEEGKRIIDAINLAGGLSDNANTININLSKKITDEMYVVIYTKNEIAEYKKNNNNNKEVVCASNECVCPDTNNDGCIKSNNKVSNKTNESLNNKISINTASLEELMALPGIGESKANSIVTYRQENGLFNSIEDIKNVSGIGNSVFEKIKDNITI